MEELFITYNYRNEQNLVLFKDESEAQNSRTLRNALDSYSHEMEKLFDNEQTLSQEAFERNHLKTKTKAVKEVILNFSQK